MKTLVAIICLIIAAIYYRYFITTEVAEEYGDDRLIVQTQYGKVKGALEYSLDNDEIYAFQRIPFAKPPIGKRRFKVAEAPDPWQHIVDATKPLPRCLYRKPTKLGQEDCLYLNVYTRNLNGNKLRPVMFYIYGGMFVENSAHIEEVGPHFMLLEDIVLVTPNYRLGILGFISGGGVEANLGMKDQVLALKWVKDNIANFGGDPNRITITGNSAGGTSVFLHMISPLSAGLFHQALIQSAKPLFNLAWKHTAKQAAGILNTNEDNLLTTLEKLTDEEIFQLEDAMGWKEICLFDECLAHPIIEGPVPNSFLPEHPFKFIQSDRFNPVPLLIGTTNNESLFYEFFFNQEQFDKILSFANAFPFAETYRPRIIDYYFTNGTDKINMSYINDIAFGYEMFKLAKETSRGGRNPVYVYEFCYNSTLNYIKMINGRIINRPGAAHADDFGYMFKQFIRPRPFKPGSNEDIYLRKNIKVIGNFVKYGRPTTNGDDLLPWPAFKPNAMYVYRLNDSLAVTQMRNEFFERWDDVFTDYYNPK